MWTRKYWSDALERVIATAAAVLVGALAGVDFGSEEFWKIVGATVAFTFLKVVAATQVGAHNTAAMLPQGADTERGSAELGLVGLLLAVVGMVLLIVEAVKTEALSVTGLVLLGAGAVLYLATSRSRIR